MSVMKHLQVDVLQIIMVSLGELILDPRQQRYRQWDFMS